MTTDQATGYRPRRAPIPPQIEDADRPSAGLGEVVSGERGVQ
jgi:hypothetical protein